MTRIERIGDASLTDLAAQLEAMLRTGKSAEEVATELGGFVITLEANSVDDAAKQAQRMHEQMGTKQ
ncbi:hypothetical protein EDF56_101195 [Novosphingobium sp. PhB165]|uniref:hypothetical protein n=1 Tax=Novosphingobium sp. PhB165 TaxID=2485105 RepID=UPI00104EA79E|nr:hypothetical protein [Novosphingobium sp. PhB165]TCM21531.1 hypothetical protein EDF56_101195 [Novosphingobium sp. PhB165]